jgi:hypothetical protein
MQARPEPSIIKNISWLANGRLLAIPSIIRLGPRLFSVTNTLAYYGTV